MRNFKDGTWIFYVAQDGKIHEEQIMMNRSSGYYHLIDDNYISDDKFILASRVDGKIVMNDAYWEGIKESIIEARNKTDLFLAVQDNTVETFKWSPEQGKLVVSNGNDV